MSRFTRNPALPLLAMMCVSTFAMASDWPQWRGTNATGYATDGTPPVEWSATKNVRWKTEIPGKGYASPIISGNRIYLLTAIKTDQEIKPAQEETDNAEAGQGRNQERGQRRGRGRRPQSPTNVYEYRVLALDQTSGDLLWNKKVHEGVPHQGVHSTSSFASISALTDGERVYAFFGSNGLFCLDLDGNVIWDKQLGQMNVRNSFGEGASPAIEGHTLVVPWDHEGDSFVAAFDASSGEEIWRNARDEATTWSSPVITEVNGQHQVIMAGNNFCMGYDLASGKELWRCGGLTMNASPTPIIGNGMAYFMSGFRGSALMAIKLDEAKGDITDTDAIAWTHDRGTPYVPSGMLADRTLYFLGSNNGILSCFDAITGEVHYQGQRLDDVRNVYSSIVGANGHVYICGREGNVAVIEDGPEFKVLSVNQLSEEGINASPAIVGDAIYLRTDSHLYCIAEPSD